MTRSVYCLKHPDQPILGPGIPCRLCSLDVTPHAPTPIRPLTRQPVPEVVTLLKELLERAEKGEIVSVAGVAIENDEDHTMFWQGEAKLSRIMYALDFWKHRQLTRQNKRTEQENGE